MTDFSETDPARPTLTDAADNVGLGRERGEGSLGVEAGAVGAKRVYTGSTPGVIGELPQTRHQWVASG